MPQPTDSAPSWVSFIKEAWDAESLGADAPGLVSMADGELWDLWQRAQKIDAPLANFDIWLSQFEGRGSHFEGSVAAQLGIAARVEAVLAAGARPVCSKCGGEFLRRRWRDVLSESRTNFPNERLVFAEQVKLPDDESLKRTYTLRKYLDVVGSERVVVDGQVRSRAELEDEFLDAPFSSSEKWHKELLIVLPSEPAEDWIGLVLGISANKDVVFRNEVSAGGLCGSCGQEGALDDFNIEMLFTDEAVSWRFGTVVLSDVCRWTVVEAIGYLKLNESYDVELLRTLELSELGVFGLISELPREAAFRLWCFVSLVLRGEELLAFDIPVGFSSQARHEIVKILALKGARLFLDADSKTRFFDEQPSARAAPKSYYRCSWTRARGGLAHRLGIFESVVAPFFETEQGRRIGVRAGSFASVGCKTCFTDPCRGCGGSGVEERYAGLMFFGVTLKEFMQRPIREAASIAEGSQRELLSRLVELGFGDTTLGSIRLVKESPAWIGYEAYVRDLLRGKVRGDATELHSLLAPLVPGIRGGMISA